METNNNLTNLFDFSLKTLQRAPLQEAIKIVLGKRKSNLWINKEKDARVFFYDVIEYIRTHDSAGRYTNAHNIVEGFKHYNVKNGIELFMLMDENREVLQKNGYNMDRLKNPTLILEKYHIKHCGEGVHIDPSTVRRIIVRSKFGNFPVHTYEYAGAVCDGEQMRQIRYDYHRQTGCSYFETRPILESTWLALPVEMQNGTCVCDYSDMEEEDFI